MTDDISSLAEAMAEIRRLRDTNEQLKGLMLQSNQIWQTELDYCRPEIERLRARIAEMETAAAVTLGTLAQPTDDEPARYTHDLPPSAPPHDE
jgi:uncharacterized protein YaaN involved in tellurite resistance